MVNFAGVSILSLKTIKEKIAYYLMQRTSKDGGKEVTIDITQTNLADLFGVNRPSLTLTILEMGKKAIFTWYRDKVIIADLK